MLSSSAQGKQQMLKRNTLLAQISPAKKEHQQIFRVVVGYLVYNCHKHTLRGLMKEAGQTFPMYMIDERREILDCFYACDFKAVFEKVENYFPNLLSKNPKLSRLLYIQEFANLVQKGAKVEALHHAQVFLAPLCKDSKSDLGDLKALLSLLTFPDPFSSPEAHHLSPMKTEAAARSLNSAMMEYQGYTGDCSLHRLMAHLTLVQGFLSSPKAVRPAPWSLTEAIQKPNVVIPDANQMKNK